MSLYSYANFGLCRLFVVKTKNQVTSYSFCSVYTIIFCQKVKGDYIGSKRRLQNKNVVYRM